VNPARSDATIAFESPSQPEVADLVAELDAFQATLYPPEDRYSLDLTAVDAGDLWLAVARDAGGRAIGCAAIVLRDDHAELKRMYVRPTARGLGIATRLLRELERTALALGQPELRLETGTGQPEAIALYLREGFERCGRFGDYPDSPLSVYMQKRLTAQRSAL